MIPGGSMITNSVTKRVLKTATSNTVLALRVVRTNGRRRTGPDAARPTGGPWERERREERGGGVPERGPLG
ncbi:hypothetical protein GCM10010341_01540 [Streptomyces noursei]|nr:hypothetical protein GCM10010341_01540 [Streptomyces noursei]